MKAVLLERFGGPENLKLSETPDPSPGPGEVLLRVRACALNHLDLWVRNGIPAYKIKLPHILGSDIAGEVHALGPGVSAVEAGARVAVAPGKSCGRCEFCLEGRDSCCAEYGIIGAHGGPGGYAEFIAVPETHLLPLPPTTDFEAAAAFPLTFLTAWHMLVGLGRVGPGQIVLVLGAGSGVGVAAVQIAKLCGAFVIAASRSRKKLEKSEGLGADQTILSSEDVPRQVRRLTQGRMADIAFEHVGPALFESALKSLRPGGRLITCGSTSGPTVSLDLRYVFGRQLQILGATMGSLSEMRRVASLVAQGRLKPVVDRVFPLGEAAKAHDYLAEQDQFGKVVLRI